MLVSRSSDQNVSAGILHRQDTLLHEQLLQQDDNGFSKNVGWYSWANYKCDCLVCLYDHVAFTPAVFSSRSFRGLLEQFMFGCMRKLDASVPSAALSEELATANLRPFL